MIKLVAPIALVAALSACATTTGGNNGPSSGGAEAIRYHLDAPIEPGTIGVEPMMRADADSPDYRIAADAVSAELARLGFQPAPSGATTRYVAVIGIQRTAAGTVRKRSPITIGIGGGSFSGGRRGGFGLGGGVSTGIGGGGERTVFNIEMQVQIRQRSDGTNVWEGRARRQEISGKNGTDMVATDAILAGAMFKDFPGESGITISTP